MQEQQKKGGAGEGPYINLNVRLFLTDIGEEQHGAAGVVKRVVGQDGSEGAAIDGEKLFARTLKEFIISRKVNKIELERVELLSRRHEITDLTKLILFSLLYRLFPDNIQMICQRRGLESAASADPDSVRIWKRDILSRSLTGVKPVNKERDPALEQKTLKSVGSRLVASIPSDVFDLFPGREEEMVRSAASLVQRYLKRSRISDHLSAAFHEWVNFSDRLNLQRAYDKYRSEYYDVADLSLDDFLKQDPGNKAQLEKIINRDRISLKINWKFGRSVQKSEDDSEDFAIVRLRLINKGLIGDALRETIGIFLTADTRGRHAGEFDHESDAPLGFLFTSFLRESCREHGIDLFVKIREDEKSEITTMSLSLRLNPARDF